MRAFVIDEFGKPGAVRDHPDPQAEDGEVLVRVRAAAVNAMDPGVAKGLFKDHMEHRLPLVPGIDGSGVVERVGPGVDGFAEGDEVFGVAAKPFFGAGTFAELATLPATAIINKPSGVDHPSAAALPHAALTALPAVEAIDPREGQVVLVVGATGGVGSFVTQLVATRGARVVAVSRGENAEHAKELGAGETIDYTEGDLVDLVRARYPDGVDAIVDMHSDQDTLTRLSAVVRKGGHVVSTAGAADAEALEERGLRGFNADREEARLPELVRLVEEGKLRLPSIREYPLEQAGDALAEMEAGHVRGKLVLTIE